MPTSAIASTAAGLTRSAGRSPRSGPRAGRRRWSGREAGGRLGATGVVDTEEQDSGFVGHQRAFRVRAATGRCESL